MTDYKRAKIQAGEHIIEAKHIHVEEASQSIITDSLDYTILDSIWRTGSTGCIGIVAVKTFRGEWKAYIGVAPCYSERADEQFIAAFGCALSLEEAQVFFPQLDSTRYKK